MLRVAPDDEFLHAKIKTKTFMWILELQKMSQKMHAVKAVWMGI